MNSFSILEWIFAVRVFEVFGIIFLLIALILAILMVTLRRKAIHTALTYIHGAACEYFIPPNCPDISRPNGDSELYPWCSM